MSKWDAIVAEKAPHHANFADHATDQFTLLSLDETPLSPDGFLHASDLSQTTFGADSNLV